MLQSLKRGRGTGLSRRFLFSDITTMALDAVHLPVQQHQAVVAVPLTAYVTAYGASGAYRADTVTASRLARDHFGPDLRAVHGVHVQRERLDVTSVATAHAAQRGSGTRVLFGHVLVKSRVVGRQAAAKFARVRSLSVATRGVVQSVSGTRAQRREALAAVGRGALQPHVVTMRVAHVLPKLLPAGAALETLLAHLDSSPCFDCSVTGPHHRHLFTSSVRNRSHPCDGVRRTGEWLVSHEVIRYRHRVAAQEIHL